MERKTEQVRHCSRTTTPSLLASLPICLSAQLSALNASCSTFIRFYAFHIFLYSLLCSTSLLLFLSPFCLKRAPSLPASVVKLLIFK